MIAVKWVTQVAGHLIFSMYGAYQLFAEVVGDNQGHVFMHSNLTSYQYLNFQSECPIALPFTPLHHTFLEAIGKKTLLKSYCLEMTKMTGKK